jgi:hypothetical protein
MKRLTTLVAAAALGAAVFVPAASADPTNAKKSLTFPATCDGTTLQVVVNGNGDLVTCSVDATLTSDEGTFRIAGTVTGFFTPASR